MSRGVPDDAGATSDGRPPPRLGSRARAQARRAALQALYQWQMTAQAPAEIEAQFREELNPRKVDLDYFRVLLRGVARDCERLDALLAPLLDRPMAQVDAVERAVLRLGVFELAERIEVPYRVVINESVELARTFGAEQGHRYVNGILDRVAPLLRPHEPRRGAPPAGDRET